MTLKDNMEHYKERVEKALQGLVVDKTLSDGDNTEYKGATSEECNKEILEIFGFLAFQILDMAECMDVFERTALRFIPKRKYPALLQEFIKARFERLPFGD